MIYTGHSVLLGLWNLEG